MEKVKKIKVSPYCYTFHVVKTDNINRSRSKRDKIIGGESWKYCPTVGGLHSYNDEFPVFESYIFLDPKQSLGIISHECYHGLRRMFAMVGAEAVDEEIMAYHLTDLVDQIYEFLNTK